MMPEIYKCTLLFVFFFSLRKSAILRRFVHGLWWNANYFTTEAPFQIRRRSLIQIDCSHSFNFEYFSYVLGFRVFFQWFLMIHRHDNSQIALNSQRTILCVLETIWEFEMSAIILILTSSLVLQPGILVWYSSLVLGIVTRRKVMNLIKIAKLWTVCCYKRCFCLKFSLVRLKYAFNSVNSDHHTLTMITIRCERR